MKSQETPITNKDTGMLRVCYGYVIGMLITPQPFGGIIGMLYPMYTLCIPYDPYTLYYNIL